MIAERRGRVLLIRLSSLGDVLLATGLPEAIALRRPGLDVEFLTRPDCAPVLAGNPGISRVHHLERGAMGRVIGELRARRFDSVVDLSGTLRSRLIALSLGRPVRTVGKDSLARRAMVRRRLRRRTLRHAVERYAAAAGDLVPPGVGLRPVVHLLASEVEAADRWLGDGPPVAALFPGAHWPTKAWPSERYLALAERLAGEAGARVIVFLGPGDDALTRVFGEVRPEALRAPGIGVHRFDVRGVAGILGRARVAVANDSAMMHLAVASGVPVVALFGPTVTGFGFRPLGAGSVVVERDLDCRPCSLHGGGKCPLGHHECLRGISVEEVLLEVLNKWQGCTPRVPQGGQGFR